ncbi:hypothetical protein [Aestuariirhabdus litorea]|uniref:Uncharacterized protein n=1 Tax=Aestuariirhabdus litorea TaxID=2528527 RepID=A0A3P3VV72_9GAMM|nr:hypothetical protein [Aestuariirhabdus litorea]RRJ85329.1 hypothetical protein D0544_09790 [Aestuariirhabdus litorea]RWW98551.1 hypothetical protein DZC74_09775 [Endozoicomonadaceae bacterium GTF-13]
MAKKDPAEDKALLDELMSIRQLLDDELQGERAPSDNIPILNEVDNGEPPPAPAKKPQPATDNYRARAESAFEANVQRGSPLLKPLTREMLGENPFLPKQALDKLNARRAMPTADSGLPQESPLWEGLRALPSDQQQQVRALLEGQSEQILQQMVDETMPRLEAQLRERLRQQLKRLIEQIDRL